MEQHPIPQNVTGFQFKLIGSMTVKQFGYVATGVICAVILYYLPLKFPLAILIKILLIPLFGGSGAFIAFVPIDGRPLDVMFLNLIRAVFSPNQYVYHKTGRMFRFAAFTPTPPPQAITQQASAKASQGKTVTKPRHTIEQNNKAQQFEEFLRHTHEERKTKLDEKETVFLQTLSGVQPTLATIPVVSEPETPKKTPVSLEQQETMLAEQLTQAKQEETQQQASDAHSSAHHKVVVLEKQLKEVQEQKHQLEKELTQLQKQLEKQKEQPKPAPVVPIATPVVPAVVVQAPTHVRNVTKEMTKHVGLPHVTDTPNVAVGIVKDSRGNVLPNMLVEVKDKDGNPVRAFKTNPLGQFASATPLAFGSYTIELEDPKKQHTFDIIQLTADNQIMLPIEIISHDAREELRKELFN